MKNKMMKDLLRVRREERFVALFALLLVTVLGALMVSRYAAVLMQPTTDYHQLVRDAFGVSGFDAWHYSVVSRWNGSDYYVFRHPLLAPLMVVPFAVNQLASLIVGTNCAVFVVAVLEAVCGFYAVLFFHRLLRDVLDVCRLDAALLTLLLFSFGYMMLTVMVPDHFGMTLCLMLALLYVGGMKMRRGERFTVRQTAVWLVLSAGISLNNSVKLFLSVLFAQGRAALRPKFLLWAFVVPTICILAIATVESQLWEAPLKRQAQQKRQMEIRRERDSIRTAYLDTATVRDEATVRAGIKRILQARAVAAYRKNHANPMVGKPIAKVPFLEWTDQTTDRWDSIVENLFGESIQIHKPHLLEDVYSGTRPMIVQYEADWHYWIEALILVLFLAGIVCAVRSKFFWLIMSWFLFDMALYVGLGFAINEVYLMTSQWAFIIPIALSFLLRRPWPWLQWSLRAVVLALTLYLFAYNGSLIARFLLA